MIVKINIGLSNIRSMSFLKKIEIPLIDLFDLTVKTSKYVNQMDFTFSKDHFELLVYHLIELCLKFELKKTNFG